MLFVGCEIDQEAFPILLHKWQGDARDVRANEFDMRWFYITITIDAAILWHMNRIVALCLIARTIDGIILFCSGICIVFNLTLSIHAFHHLFDRAQPAVGFVLIGLGLSAALALVWIMRSWREDWRDRFLQIGDRYG